MYSPDSHPVIIAFRKWVCSRAGVSVSHEEVTVAVAGTVIGTVAGSYWYSCGTVTGRGAVTVTGTGAVTVTGTVADTVAGTVTGTVTGTVAGSYWYSYWYRSCYSY